MTFANAAMLAAPFESNGLTGIVIRSGTKSNWHFCPILQHDDDDEKWDDFVILVYNQCLMCVLSTSTRQTHSRLSGLRGCDSQLVRQEGGLQTCFHYI